MRYYLGRQNETKSRLLPILACTAVLLCSGITASAVNTGTGGFPRQRDDSTGVEQLRHDARRIQVAAMTRMRWEAKARAMQEWGEPE